MVHIARDIVYRISDGEDPDWASWYSDWLTRLSDLAKVLGADVVRSQLTHELVALDREYAEAAPDKPWERFYAARLIERLGT